MFPKVAAQAPSDARLRPFRPFSPAATRLTTFPSTLASPCGRTDHRRAASAPQRYAVAPAAGESSFTWKLEPQPHAATTFGLLTAKPAPWRPST